MPDRRSLIGAGLAAGIGAAAGVEAAPQQSQERILGEIVTALGQIRREMQTSREQANPGHGILETIRQHQRTFLKASQKYPDYMDVGIRAWDAISDWHARFGVVVERDAPAGGPVCDEFHVDDLHPAAGAGRGIHRAAV